MHKGNPYPYHPSYWATECQFWPGYVPWKLFLDGFLSSDPTMTPVGTLIGEASEAGVTVTDYTQISWRWPIVSNPDADELIVSLEMEEISGSKYAVWIAQLRLLSVPVGTAYLFLPFPRYSESTGGAAIWGTTHDPVAFPPHSQINLRGATYAEGGSPWP